jgi:monovalent cation:H+ antiporter-2, CPA2 family
LVPVLAAVAGADAPRLILELGAVVLLGAGLGWAARRLGLPSLAGFLAAGVVVAVLAGPLAIDHAQLELLADLGVVLLLFEAGVEIDFARLRGGGMLGPAMVQVVVTTTLVAVAAALLGLDGGGALLLGACVALSSSVVVAHVVNSRRRTTNPATEAAMVDWAAVQDVGGVAMTVAVLAAIGFEGRPGPELAARLALYGLVLLGAAWALPFVLRAFRPHDDLFLLMSVGSSITLAGLGAAAFRLPVPLAAFLGGAVAGGSPEMAAVRQQLRPFRELFALLFFVALPTLIAPGELTGALGWLAFTVLALAVGKAVVVVALARVAKRPGVRPLQLGIGLGQMGEFSFAIALIAQDHGALPEPVSNAVLVALLASMAVTPVLARLGGERRAAEAVEAGEA